MSKYFRRVCIGLLSGVVSCIILVAILNNVLEGICLGVLAGIAYAFIFHSDQRTYADNIMMAAVAGIVLWGSVNVVFLPLLGGQPPQWTVVGVRALFPSLVDFILWSICLGLLTAIFSDLAMYFLGKEDQLPLKRTVETRVIIVGGGFAGLATAEHLEQAFGADTSVSFTLISDVNALLFTPMLAEVAGGSLEPTHISTPLRSSLRRTRVVHGRVEQIDTAQKQVILAPELHSSQPRVMVFDHLVLAVGSVSNYAGLKGVEEHALDFKSLADSIRIREHVITMLERADQIVDPIQHRAMLTFVVAGGGFAGAELAGSLNDFVHGAIPYYPGISQNEVKIILLHSRDHILPELSQSLGDYALERMAARGVTFKLNTRLVDAQKGVVVLDTGESIRAETLVWTAGVKPHPLVQTLAAECDRRGALIVDSFLAVLGYQVSGHWAIVPW